jgi:hypothetical protein
MTGDARILRRLNEQAWHPDMETVPGSEDAEAFGGRFRTKGGEQAEKGEEEWGW